MGHVRMLLLRFFPLENLKKVAFNICLMLDDEGFALTTLKRD